jgi:hypothetical protein
VNLRVEGELRKGLQLGWAPAPEQGLEEGGQTVWGDLYASEKLREFEAERERRAPRRLPPPARRLVVRPLAQRVGQALRHIGEGLETWGSSPPARQTHGGW